MTNRSLCVGFLLVLAGGIAGGCASQHANKQQSVASTKAGAGPALTQLVDGAEAKFVQPSAPATPADLLTRQTESYIKPFSKDAVDAGRSDSQLNSTPARPIDPFRHIDRKQTAAVVEGSPIGQPASAFMSPTLPASEIKTTKTAEGPRIEPESSDYPASANLSKDAIGTRLRKRLRDNPHDIVALLDLQLYGIVNDEPAADLASYSELPGDDRDLVATLIDGLSNFRSTVREDANLLTAKKIQPLLEMAERLRSQADLTVSTVALCRKVEGFGKYEPITPSRFGAGKENAAIVYCEVQNFMPKQEGLLWKTRLSEEVTLYTDTGMLAWSDERRDVIDECRNLRHDFFAYNIIKLPATLTVGRYMLKVTIEDKNSDRVAESTVPLEIVGK